MVIDFTLEDLQILDEALQNLPYRRVAQLIGKINQQLSEQQQSPDLGSNTDDQSAGQS